MLERDSRNLAAFNAANISGAGFAAVSRQHMGTGRRSAADRRRIGVACLFAGLVVCVVGLVSGCTGGMAPVQTPREASIPGSAREHVVGKGETMYAIAWRYGVDYRALARFNSIRDPFTIHPGQRILIPDADDVILPAAEDNPPAAAPQVVRSEPDAPQDVKIRGTGSQAGPVVAALPSPPAPPARPLPRTSPKKPPARQESEANPPAAPARTKQAAVSLPNRNVAGMHWGWPTQGQTIGTFKGAGKGFDIAGTFEQPIRAAATGRVVYAGGGLVGYGQLVIVKHDAGLLSAYAHNERLHVKEGDAVRGGQHIADMGRSAKGRALLHFEIRRDGKPVDPGGYLP